MQTKIKDELTRQARHFLVESQDMGLSEVEIKDGDRERELRFILHDINKYKFRNHFIHEFIGLLEPEQYGISTDVDRFKYELVAETFTEQEVSAVLVNTSVFEATVRKFRRERRTTPPSSLEGYNSLDLHHVEALEQWGAVNRLNELQPKHIHDAFIEYSRTCEGVKHLLPLEY